MATRVYIRTTKTHPDALRVVSNYLDMRMASVVSVATMYSHSANEVNGERPFGTGNSSSSIPVTLFSERIPSEVTVSGSITVFLNGLRVTTSLVTARIRARVFKITNGGSDILSLLGQVDGAANLTTTLTDTTLTMTPTSTVLAPNERLVLQLCLIPDPTTGLFGSTTGQIGAFAYNNGSGSSYLELTETMTLKPNGLRLQLRRTNTIGIGTFFDLSEARGGSAATTGTVATSAGGTEIQWTRTSGGTVLEWISPRFASGWSFSDALAVVGDCWAGESNIAANCGIRYKVFHRTPGGTETLVYQKDSVELTTATQNQVMQGGSLIQAKTFAEDDRLVLRAYIINIGTMGGGQTCVLTYDHNVGLGTGDASITVYDAAEVKLESDPGASSRVPGGQTLGGVGN